jgi:hypothetical protein
MYNCIRKLYLKSCMLHTVNAKVAYTSLVLNAWLTILRVVAIRVSIHLRGYCFVVLWRTAHILERWMLRAMPSGGITLTGYTHLQHEQVIGTRYYVYVTYQYNWILTLSCSLYVHVVHRIHASLHAVYYTFPLYAAGNNLSTQANFMYNVTYNFYIVCNNTYLSCIPNKNS